jgi:hypothetical protein
MPRFAVPGNKGAASVQGIVGARADAIVLGRGRVYDYMVASVTTPADNVFDHQLMRTSTAGTGAAVTPSPLDVADTASIFDATDTYTIDPTIGVELLRVPLNHRATYRWVAAPGGELIWPATASNGILGGLAAASTTDFSATLMVDGF